MVGVGMDTLRTLIIFKRSVTAFFNFITVIDTVCALKYILNIKFNKFVAKSDSI